MELMRFIWTWDLTMERLRAHDPVAAYAVHSGSRPLAAERRQDGMLELVLGFWYPGHLQVLTDARRKAVLDDALSSLFGERLVTLLVPWPGPPVAPGDERDQASRRLLERLLAGTVDPELVPLPEPSPPSFLPDLAEPPHEVLQELARCESALQRYFFAGALQRGLHPRAQYQVAAFRLDFAILPARLGIEIEGWQRRGGARLRGFSEREGEVEGEGWRVLHFAGEEVHADLSKCLDRVAAELSRGPGRPGSALSARHQPRPRRHRW